MAAATPSSARPLSPFRRFVRKIIAGDPHRRTRLHDEKGNLAHPGEWLYLPLVLERFLGRVLFGHLHAEPWWTFRIKKRIAQLLGPGTNAVEFGSGQSTLWLGARVGRLLSIEENADWAARVKTSLARAGLGNVVHELRPPESYADLSAVPDGSVDFCVIDGYARGRCAAAVLPKMKDGGWVYLDNSDKDMGQPEDGFNVRSAEATLRAAAAPGGIETFTGFTIGFLNTHQGTLFRIRRA